MKIKEITLKNIKSFKEETTIKFDNNMNILIGPNSSGKSNVLDIINSIFRGYFLRYSYEQEGSNNGVAAYSIITNQLKQKDLVRLMPKYYGDNSEQIIKISLILEDKDFEVINNILTYQNELIDAQKKYQTPSISIDHLKNLSNILQDETQFSYEIIDYNISQPKLHTSERFLLNYFNIYNIIAILANQFDIFEMYPPILLFQSFRVDSAQNLQATLSGNNLLSMLESLNNSSTDKVHSLIGLSTWYLSEKKRLHEIKYSTSGIENYQDFTNEECIQNINIKLAYIGYKIGLDCRDSYKNTYEVIIYKDGMAIPISDASSGEKEILNFILAFYTLNINDCTVVVDEPELHLHPRWQHILLDLLNDISLSRNIQFIFATHSATFVRVENLTSITRVYLNENQSRILKIAEISADAKDILHIINSTNNEKIFFSDIVFMVEGITDELIFTRIIDEVISENNFDKVIEIVNIKGKGNQEKFRTFLESIGINTFFIADLDYLVNCGTAEIKEKFRIDYSALKEALFKKMNSKDADRLIYELEKAIDTCDTDSLKDFMEYAKARKSRPEKVSDEEILEFIEKRFAEYKEIILARGDIEKYFPIGFQAKKLENVIELLKQDNYSTWKSESGYSELRDSIERALKQIN